MNKKKLIYKRRELMQFFRLVYNLHKTLPSAVFQLLFSCMCCMCVNVKKKIWFINVKATKMQHPINVFVNC